MITPVLFFGLTDNFLTNDDLKVSLKLYCEKIKDLKYLLLCIPSEDSSRNITVYSNSNETKKGFLRDIESNITNLNVKICFDDYSKINNLQRYLNYTEYLFSMIPVIFISVPNDRQLALMIGKQLQEYRKDQVLLVGFGNITHNSKKTLSKKEERLIYEFDSWVRIKIWEFDYFALRDFEKYIGTNQEVIQDEIRFYMPFLFIFGAYFGTDEIIDLYAGFENYSSLRSFVLQTL